MNLKGTKTYLIAAGAAVATLFKYLGFLDNDSYMTLMGMFNAAGLASLRAGVTTEVKKL